MKKKFNIILIVLLSLCLFACNENKNINNDNKNNEEQQKDNNVVDIDVDIVPIEDGKTLSFSRMLVSADDIKTLDITDEYQSACAIIFALSRYEENPDVSKEMLEYINGPEDVSEFDIDFIKNQIEQYPFVMRSYFDNTKPEEDYVVNKVEITIKENMYSRDEDGYVKLWLHSSGADSDRSVMLRKKESTGEWFLYSDSYKGLMAGIRKPASEDKWS